MLLCIGNLSGVNYVMEHTRSGKDATAIHVCFWFIQMLSLEINTKKQQSSQPLCQNLANGIIFWDYPMTTWDVCNENRKGKGLLWAICKSCCVSVLAFWNFICCPRSISSLCISSCSLEKQIYSHRYLLPAKALCTVILYELYASQYNKVFL